MNPKAKPFLVVCTDGRRRTFSTAHDVAVFLWGKQLSAWSVYRLCPLDSPEIGDIEAQLNLVQEN